jgi:tetratricopeptide (TPR) repeat protein
MKKMYLILFLFSVGCASFKPVTIETNPPKAKVLVYDDEQKKFVKVGETPFVLNAKKRDEIIKSNNTFVAFKVERPGYVVEHIIYDLKTKKKINYLLQLKEIEIWSDKDAELSSKLANDIAKKVQSLNRFILTKKLNEALVVTMELNEQYPKAYIFYDIKGSIHLLKGNKKKAIGSFKKSLALNPDNVESENVLKILVGGKR